jgi:hypothetical protein
MIADVPMPGDLVKVRSDKDCSVKAGSVGIIEGELGRRRRMNLVCFNDSTFRDDEYVSASGGPAYCMDMSRLRPSPQIINKLFWRWRNGVRGAGCAEYYFKQCRVWVLR